MPSIWVFLNDGCYVLFGGTFEILYSRDGPPFRIKRRFNIKCNIFKICSKIIINNMWLICDILDLNDIRMFLGGMELFQK